ncbi:hypothetical protein EC973_005546 [Apophysomyces ossiformis]|uniref:DH domain-containing protein n=1 Tax=Apophysomyces ossiformis TaxID=679940 RepID=A0A8H7BG01_9FUNG|nr:hypothetical protein EC973_005546 [Apophysomyces ossiformis]
MGKFNFKTLGSIANPRIRTSHGGKVRKRAAEFLPKKIAVFRSSFQTNRNIDATPKGLLLTAEQDAAAYEEFRLLYCPQETIDDPPTWRDSLSQEYQDMMSLTQSQVQYQELIHEIILTEKTFVTDLSLVYHIFAKDALTWEHLPQSLRYIFETITQIIQDLKHRQAREYPVINTIADIFIDYVPWLTIYTTYFVHFEAANDLVVGSLASKSDSFGNYLRCRTAWPECRNLTLQSFLLKPIQRLMKYPLFFKSLIECLNIHDVAVKDHFEALNDIEKVIRKIESEKKEAEDFKKLEDLESRIKGIEVRSKTRPTPFGRSGEFYGPQPEALFKVVQTPGQLTCVDPTVTRPVESNRQSQFGSWRNHRVSTQVTHEAHPLQFICSVAACNVFNMHFEARTPEEKQAWCHHLEMALPEHVKTPSSWQLQPRSTIHSYQSQPSLTYDSCTTMLDDIDGPPWADCEDTGPSNDSIINLLSSEDNHTLQEGTCDDTMEVDGNRQDADDIESDNDEGFVTARNSLNIGEWLQHHRPEIDRGEKFLRGMQETGRIPNYGPFSIFKMDSLFRGGRMRS